jgi:DNA-binding NarL/FixJ family response regulator
VLALHDASEEAALRQALQIFTGLGAPATAQLTRHTMRQLGIRSIPAGPRPATRAHPLGLTRREREVLGVICAGHSHAEIAAKLVLSTRTVDHHVSAVLAKLGARPAAPPPRTPLGSGWPARRKDRYHHGELGNHADPARGRSSSRCGTGTMVPPGDGGPC